MKGKEFGFYSNSDAKPLEGFKHCGSLNNEPPKMSTS